MREDNVRLPGGYRTLFFAHTHTHTHRKNRICVNVKVCDGHLKKTMRFLCEEKKKRLGSTSWTKTCKQIKMNEMFFGRLKMGFF